MPDVDDTNDSSGEHAGAPRTGAPGYGIALAILHWLVAVLIVASFVLGYRMEDAPRSTSLWMYRAHAVLGVTILLLTLVRLLRRALGPMPPPPPGLAGRHLAGVRASHALLYVLTLSMVATGAIGAWRIGAFEVLLAENARGAPIVEPDPFLAAHAACSTALGVLVLAHVVGVLVHQVRFGGVLMRMSGLRRP